MNLMQQRFYNIGGKGVLHYTEGNLLIYHTSQKDEECPNSTKMKRNGTRSEIKRINLQGDMKKDLNPSKVSAIRRACSCTFPLSPRSTESGWTSLSHINQVGTVCDS